MREFLSVLPTPGQAGVPTNGQLMLKLHGYFRAPKKVALFKKLALRASHAGGAKRISLRLDARYESSRQSFGFTVLLFHPRRRLEPNTRYTLVWPPSLSRQASAAPPQTFTTGAGPLDATPPALAVKDTVYQYSLRGCGPTSAFWLALNRPAAGLTYRIQLATSRRALLGGKLEADFVDDTPNIGLGQCSINYPVRRGRTYWVRVAAINAAGKQGAFSGPVKLTANPRARGAAASCPPFAR